VNCGSSVNRVSIKPSIIPI
jgi:hypothetical protein